MIIKDICNVVAAIVNFIRLNVRVINLEKVNFVYDEYQGYISN